MPQSPSANPAQKEILEALINLAQNDAVATGNQIAVLDDQITRFQNARTLFVDRYNYWNNYILRYHEERRMLNGQFIMYPIQQIDYDDFLGAKGRLYLKNLVQPVRIREFDNVGFSTTGQDANAAEAAYLAQESLYRNILVSGFTAPKPLPALPPSVTYRNSSFTSGQQEIFISRSDLDPIMTWPSGSNQLLFYSAGNPTAGVLVSYLEATPVSGSIRLRGLQYAPGFSPIPLGPNVDDSGPVFSNAIRTTQTAPAAQQSRLYAYIQAYRKAVADWNATLTLQYAKIQQEIAAGEDDPDTAYITTLQTMQADLTAYLAGPTIDVSDTGLAMVSGYATTRGPEVADRIAYIDARLIQQTKAYDERFQYVIRLYNYSDGVIPMLNRFNAQRAELLQMQAASNYRAAQFSEESF